MHEASILEEYRIQTFYTAADEHKPSPSAGLGRNDKYKSLIIELTKILCKRKYRKQAMEYMQRDYFPIEDCLEICEGKGVRDACAILYRRRGDFDRSITEYTDVLTKLA